MLCNPAGFNQHSLVPWSLGISVQIYLDAIKVHQGYTRRCCKSDLSNILLLYRLFTASSSGTEEEWACKFGHQFDLLSQSQIPFSSPSTPPIPNYSSSSFQDNQPRNCTMKHATKDRISIYPCSPYYFFPLSGKGLTHQEGVQGCRRPSTSACRSNL